jgi:putative photosynthetic complex assembly protein
VSEAVNDQVPPALITAAAALILATLVVVAWSRLTAPAPVAATSAGALKVRALFFEDRPDGSVAVLDARSGQLTRTLASGEDGFVRATLRTMAHERRRRGLGAETPFELAELDHGRVVLIDPATGRSVDLEAFGSTNFAAFARLLASDAPQPLDRKEPR